jgi:hypothetical protein
MPPVDKAIRAAATAAVVVLALIAFAVSYAHIYELAIRLGEQPLVAQLYPVTVDGLLVTAALVGLYCSRYRLSKPTLARGALFLGIGATVISNVAHGITDGLGAAIFAGWPAVALLVAAELLLWLVAAAQSLDARQVVILEGESPDEASVLSRALTLLANDRSLTAAELEGVWTFVTTRRSSLQRRPKNSSAVSRFTWPGASSLWESSARGCSLGGMSRASSNQAYRRFSPQTARTARMHHPPRRMQ